MRVINRRAASPPGSPSGEPRGANIAGIAASYVRAVVVTGLAAAASGSPTVFTCKAEDQLESQMDAAWGVPVSSVMAVLALMALSAAIGRWSAPRSSSKELAQDPEPWVVVSEITALLCSEQNDEKRPVAGEESVGVEREGSRAPSKLPRAPSGSRRAAGRAGGGLAGSMYVYGRTWMREGAVPSFARCGAWLNAHVSPQ